jgi:NADH-quinone oxidoreductase subunit J
MSEAWIDVVLIVSLVLAALWTVLATRRLRSVVGLAAASVVLTALLFRLRSPLAAVFELSVCAGLISAVFLGAISVTALETPESLAVVAKERLRRYWYLPVLLLVIGIPLASLPLPTVGIPSEAGGDVREVLWNVRHLDLLGQIVLLLAGAFGVVVLFKDGKHER